MKNKSLFTLTSGEQTTVPGSFHGGEQTTVPGTFHAEKSDCKDCPWKAEGCKGTLEECIANLKKAQT
jgi:hypothetical protein